MQSEFFDIEKTSDPLVINTSKSTLGEYLLLKILNTKKWAIHLQNGIVCLSTSENPMKITDATFIKGCLNSEEKSCPPIVWLFGCIEDRDQFFKDNADRLEGLHKVKFECFNLEEPVLWTMNKTTRFAGDQKK